MLGQDFCQVSIVLRTRYQFQIFRAVSALRFSSRLITANDTLTLCIAIMSRRLPGVSSRPRRAGCMFCCMNRKSLFTRRDVCQIEIRTNFLPPSDHRTTFSPAIPTITICQNKVITPVAAVRTTTYNPRCRSQNKVVNPQNDRGYRPQKSPASPPERSTARHSH